MKVVSLALVRRLSVAQVVPLSLLKKGLDALIQRLEHKSLWTLTKSKLLMLLCRALIVRELNAVRLMQLKLLAQTHLAVLVEGFKRQKLKEPLMKQSKVQLLTLCLKVTIEQCRVRWQQMRRRVSVRYRLLV